MNSSFEQIKSQIVPVLKKAGVTRSALFGSCVRGEMSKESDVDLLIEFPPEKSLLEFLRLKLELEKNLCRGVDLVEYITLKPIVRESVFSEKIEIL